MDAKTRYKAKKIKIVFFDIDDTLRNVETGYVPASVTRVFSQLREKEIYTAIASGRGIFGVPEEIKALQPDFYVTLNGSYVIDRKENVIYEERVPNPLVQDFIAWAKQVGIHYGLVGSHQAALSARTEEMSQAIDPIYPNLPVDPDFAAKHSIYQMWTFETGKTFDALPEALGQELRLVRWHPISSDVVLDQQSKAHGVSKVVEKLGLKPENVLTFGDGLNDLELFDYAGFSDCHGECPGCIKSQSGLCHKKLRRRWYFTCLRGVKNG